MLAIHPLRRIGVAHVAASAIATHTVAVIPASRVLTQISAERPGVAVLWARHAPRGPRGQRVFAAYQIGALDLGEPGEGADPQPRLRLAYSGQALDPRELDDRGGALVAIL